MKIEHLQHAIAESLANLPTSNLPEQLKGLRHLPLTDHTLGSPFAALAVEESAGTQMRVTSILTARSRSNSSRPTLPTKSTRGASSRPPLQADGPPKGTPK